MPPIFSGQTRVKSNKGEQMLSWKLHGDGKTISPGEVVSTDERLTWPRTIGMGLQHIVAMFGAT